MKTIITTTLMILAAVLSAGMAMAGEDCILPGTETVVPYPGIGPIWCNNPPLADACQATCDAIDSECFFGDLGTYGTSDPDYMEAYSEYVVGGLVPWVQCCMARISTYGKLDPGLRRAMFLIHLYLRK